MITSEWGTPNMVKDGLNPELLLAGKYAVWSFLMAAAHGAGLMVVQVLLGSSTVQAHGQMAGHSHLSPSASPLVAVVATGVHTVAYLAVTGLVAWVVYRKLGLALLRKAWLNFDLVWAAALLAAGLVALLRYPVMSSSTHGSAI